MTSLDKQIEAVAALLRAQGGLVKIDPGAPEEIKRAWLQMILECPDCRESLMGKHGGQGN